MVQGQFYALSSSGHPSPIVHKKIFAKQSWALLLASSNGYTPPLCSLVLAAKIFGSSSAIARSRQRSSQSQAIPLLSSLKLVPCCEKPCLGRTSTSAWQRESLSLPPPFLELCPEALHSSEALGPLLPRPFVQVSRAPCQEGQELQSLCCNGRATISFLEQWKPRNYSDVLPMSVSSIGGATRLHSDLLHTGSRSWSAVEVFSDGLYLYTLPMSFLEVRLETRSRSHEVVQHQIQPRPVLHKTAVTGTPLRLSDISDLSEVGPLQS